ncbi:MAG: MalY/PatB family protein [Candidatus Promineifilaceae bacterium]
MTEFHFDQEIDRFNTHCLKWESEPGADHKTLPGESAYARHGDERLLPLWVADMDFRSPPEVIEALVERAAHGVYGYSTPADCYYEAVQDWMVRRYNREVQRDWIVITPGVVAALKMMIQAYTQPGDKVIIQTPVYHPFHSAVEENDRRLVYNPLKRVGDRYEMDFEDLERKVIDPLVKLAILCSPHNPVGRVWTPEELRRFGEICLDNGVLVISDEIHADLIYDGFTFASFACLGERFAQFSVICTAPSKTFNLAGLKLSNIIIENDVLRAGLEKVLSQNGASGTNAFGIVAAEAAYRYGEPWLEAVMAYIQENYSFLTAFIAENMPQLTVIPPEGTYLVWIDFSALGLDPEERRRLLLEDAHVWLNEGRIFGPEGAGFERINIACPRQILAEALQRIRTVIQ